MSPIGRSQVIYNGLAIAVVGVVPVKNTMTNLVHSSCACESGFLQGEHTNKQQEVRDPGNQVIAIASVCVCVCVWGSTGMHACAYTLSVVMLIL